MLQVVGETSLGVKIVHSLRANQSICSATQVAAAVVAATNQQQQQGQEEKLIFEQQQQPQQTVSPSSILPDCWVSKLSGARTPPEALRSCRDPKCSHWNTLIGCKPTNQALNPIQANQLIGQIDSKVISNIDSNYSTIDSFSLMKSMKSSEREAFLLKQQKLALFNQILAQQLLLLSYQQSQNQSAYSGYFHDDNQLSSTTMSPQNANVNNNNFQLSPAHDRLETINSQQPQQPQQPQIQQLQQRHRVVLNSNTSVPQGVVDGTSSSGQLNNRNNLYHRRQQIGAQDILIGAENITCYTNAFEKCSSIAYKLMTADSRRHNNSRHFNKTFDNPSMQSTTTQQHQLNCGTGKSSRDNFEKNEQNLKLRTLREQGSWLTNDSSDNKVIITKYKGEFKVFLSISKRIKAQKERARESFEK